MFYSFLKSPLGIILAGPFFIGKYAMKYATKEKMTKKHSVYAALRTRLKGFESRMLQKNKEPRIYGKS